MSDLRNRVIRLARSHEILRPHLLKVLVAADEKDEDEGDKEASRRAADEGEGDKEADGVEAHMTSKQFKSWIGKQPQKVQDDWKSNTEKYKDKFKGAAERVFMAAAIKVYAGCEKLPEGKMRDNCEKKSKDGDKDKEAALLSAGCEKLPEGKMRDNCEKKSKEAAFRNAVIRLAHSNKALQPYLLPLIHGKGSLRNATIRLAHSNKALQPHLLQLLG